MTCSPEVQNSYNEILYDVVKIFIFKTYSMSQTLTIDMKGSNSKYFPTTYNRNQTLNFIKGFVESLKTESIKLLFNNSIHGKNFWFYRIFFSLLFVFEGKH